MWKGTREKKELKNDEFYFPKYNNRDIQKLIKKKQVCHPSTSSETIQIRTVHAVHTCNNKSANALVLQRIRFYQRAHTDSFYLELYTAHYVCVSSHKYYET